MIEERANAFLADGLRVVRDGGLSAGDAIITKRKGTGGMNVVAKGKAAHAGNAHEHGKNAIWALARFIDRPREGAEHAARRGEGLTIRSPYPERRTGRWYRHRCRWCRW